MSGPSSLCLCHSITPTYAVWYLNKMSRFHHLNLFLSNIYKPVITSYSQSYTYLICLYKQVFFSLNHLFPLLQSFQSCLCFKMKKVPKWTAIKQTLESSCSGTWVCIKSADSLTSSPVILIHGSGFWNVLTTHTHSNTIPRESDVDSP